MKYQTGAMCKGVFSGSAGMKLLLRTLAEQLFENGKVRTTEAKARRLRPLAETHVELTLWAILRQFSIAFSNHLLLLSF